MINIYTILCSHKNKQLIGISLILLTILTTACGKKVITNTNININTQQVESTTADYYLRSGDSITVKFFNHPELTENVRIRPDGKISLQLIDDIKVEGLTPSELDTKLDEIYEEHLNNAEITVIVQDSAGQEVYIAGEVKRPNTIIIKGRLNALQAIFDSGGFTDDAKISEVVIISRGPENKPVARKINLKKALKGKLLENEYLLRPFDVVYIPKTKLAKIDDFTTHIYRIIPPRIWRGLNYESGTSFEINW
jgi:protein involved in polysaccharide export with SLBB domain